MTTRFNIKIKWNQIPRNKIEKKNQIQNKMKSNQYNEDQIWYNEQITRLFVNFKGQHDSQWDEREKIGEKKKSLS